MNPTSLLAKFVVQRRGVVCVLLASLTLVAIQGFFVSTAPTDLFVRGDNEPAVQPPPAFLVIESPRVFTTQNMRAIRAAINAVDTEPVVARTTWLADVPEFKDHAGMLARFWPYELPDYFKLGRVLPAPTDSVDWKAVRQKSLQNPLAAEQLVSADGEMLLVILEYTTERPFELSAEESYRAHYEDLIQVARTAAATELAGREIEPGEVEPLLESAELSISMTGSIPLFFDNRRSMAVNQLKFQIIGYTLAGIIAALLFRGVVPIVIVGLAPFFSVIWSIGLLRLCDQPPNALTTPILPVLIAMVGLTDGVHLMTHIRRKRAQGDSPIQAARSAIREVGAACFLTSLTTAIGFGSLVLADSSFVQSFGLACAVAVLLTFVAVVTVIPIACTLPIAKNIHAGHEHDLVGKGLHHFDWLINAVLRHKLPVAIGGVLLTIALCVGSAFMQPDHSVNRAVPTWSPAKATLFRVDEKLGGVNHVRVFVRWKDGDPDWPELVAALQSVEAVIARHNEFSKPFSLLNLLRLKPGDESTLAQNLPPDSLPGGVLKNFVDKNRRLAHLTVRIRSTGIAQYQPVLKQVEGDLKQLSEKHPQLEFELGGDAIVHSRGLLNVVMNLVVSLGAASIIIFIIMTLVYRSLVIGLVTIVPNLFPLAATGVLLVLFDWPLDISAVCAFTVCLGIAVDDTIHFLSRYQQELAADETADVNAAICRTFHKVGVALIMTTVVMVIGFATIITSDLPGQQTFGAMCCCTIAAALFGDMIILPALLALFVGRKSGANAR